MKDREEIKGMTKQKMARRHSKGGGNHLEQDSFRQTMESIDGGLQPAVDGQSLTTTTCIDGGGNTPLQVKLVA